MAKSFGSSELCLFLKKHGFTPRRLKATSQLVYTPPESFKVNVEALRPFITVVLGRKSYDPITAGSIRRNLIRLGFSEDDLEILS